MVLEEIELLLVGHVEHVGPCAGYVEAANSHGLVALPHHARHQLSLVEKVNIDAGRGMGIELGHARHGLELTQIDHQTLLLTTQLGPLGRLGRGALNQSETQKGQGQGLEARNALTASSSSITGPFRIGGHSTSEL